MGDLSYSHDLSVVTAFSQPQGYACDRWRLVKPTSTRGQHPIGTRHGSTDGLRQLSEDGAKVDSSAEQMLHLPETAVSKLLKPEGAVCAGQGRS